MIGATNSTLTLTNVASGNNGNYDVVITSDGLSFTSSVATFTLVVAPVIASATPPASDTIWMNYEPVLSAFVTNVTGLGGYPLSYVWQFNGTNIAGATSSGFEVPYVTTSEGNYSEAISNAAGNTNATWNMRWALPGMVEAWGSDANGGCDRPVSLTNATAIAAGEYQSVAVTDLGTVVQWGKYSYGTNIYPVSSTNVASQPPSTGVVAVAAGLQQGLALMTNGTVTNWGLTSSYGVNLSTNQYLTNVTAIACGWQFDLACCPTAP